VAAMESRKFSGVLRAAICGDADSVEAILYKYMPLINNKSINNNEFDEDLKQYILLRVIIQIPKFNPDI
jgi:hypothetical protein